MDRPYSGQTHPKIFDICMETKLRESILVIIVNNKSAENEEEINSQVAIGDQRINVGIDGRISVVNSRLKMKKYDPKRRRRADASQRFDFRFSHL